METTTTAPKTGRATESKAQGFESTKQGFEQRKKSEPEFQQSSKPGSEQDWKSGHMIRDAATAVGQKAEDVACAVTCKVDEAAAAAARGIESVASQIRSHMPDGGMVGAASNKIADSLEQGGKYLKEQGVTGIAEDLTTLVRRNPMTALCLGVGFGFLLARATTCRNS